MVPRIVRHFGTIRVDTMNWPILLMDAGAYAATDAELEGALDYVTQVYRACLAAGEKCAHITDISRATNIPPATQRRMAGEWVKQNRELMRVACAGGGAVTPSAIIRGIVTAIYWIQTPPTPQVIVATLDEAMVASIKHLEDARVPLPPDVKKLRDEIAARGAGRRNLRA
jgi:hypothetical protein